jgi:hypothetical protein
MMQVELLEQQVTELDDAAFIRFRTWFAEFEQSRWDKQIEADSNEQQQGKTRTL